MSANLLLNVKAQGQTSASAVIATVANINAWSDGTWSFTDAQGDVIVYNGDCPPINKLLELMFVGTGGFVAGTKLFGWA